jgi:hypothetical protein
MELTTIIVRWTGPHAFGQLVDADACNGLYLLAGRRKYQRTTQIQYCGITERRFCERLTSRHHRLSEIRRDTLAIWIGTPVYPAQFTRDHLEIAEHCFVYFWQPDLNERKSAYHPKRPICFISLRCPPLLVQLFVDSPSNGGGKRSVAADVLL